MWISHIVSICPIEKDGSFVSFWLWKLFQVTTCFAVPFLLSRERERGFVSFCLLKLFLVPLSLFVDCDSDRH